MAVTINDSDTIKQQIINQYADTVPGLDLADGSTENDILVQAPVDGALSTLEQQIGYVNLVQSLSNWSLMQNDDLENLVSNYLGSNPRLQATKSSGTAWFYSPIAPAVNLTINSGVLISTIDGIQFVTTESQVMFASLASLYYDATLNLWGIEVAIQSVNSGANQNIAAGLIKTLVTSISGITTVNNKLPTTGGIDQESNQSLVNRAIATFQSRGLETLLGLQTFLKQQTGVLDAFCIDGESPLMVRDGGLGGKIDAYIRGTTIQSYTQNSVNTSSGWIQLDKIPFYSIVSVVGNRTYVNGTDYNIITSTGAYLHSTLEITKLVWTSTGVATIGEGISINYNYEKLVNDFQTLLDLPENHIPNRDILFFQTIQVTINITASIYISGDETVIKNSISSAIGNYINNLPLASLIEKSEVLALIKDTTGVENINTTTFTMLPSGGGTVTSIGDIQLAAKEYALAAQPVITIVT